MEDPRQLQTLNMSEATALSFPPRLRRPIRSQTYLNLIQLISHCYTDSSQLHGSSEGVGLRRGSDENTQINHGELKSAELLVPNDMLVQGNGIYKSVANVGFQDGDLVDGRATVTELGGAKVVTNREEIWFLNHQNRETTAKRTSLHWRSILLKNLSIKCS
ncbi:uncharacterized protein [Henckelia pumila]|uniref:uncharacterized protein isoform X1 n=1 Tax=Henckelia pumila TaxID=405737 RepID=UPI003C6E24E1